MERSLVGQPTHSTLTRSSFTYEQYSLTAVAGTGTLLPAGRKMLQHYKSSGGRGAEVAALTGTTANINKAVAEHKKPTASNPGDKLAVTPKIATGASTKVAATATPTTAIAAGPKTDKGGAAEGAPQVGMTAAAVAINK